MMSPEFLAWANGCLIVSFLEIEINERRIDLSRSSFRCFQPYQTQHTLSTFKKKCVTSPDYTENLWII